MELVCLQTHYKLDMGTTLTSVDTGRKCIEAVSLEPPTSYKNCYKLKTVNESTEDFDVTT